MIWKAADGLPEPASDASGSHSDELLATIDTLPKDAQAVGQLLKQGCLPVPHDELAAVPDLTKELLVGSSGVLADFCSFKIFNGGLLDASGKGDEVTGWLMLSFIVETWTLLQQFSSPERLFKFDYDKSNRVTIDPSAYNHQPDMVIVTEGLLMFFGEEACKSMDQARDDASKTFPYGLSPLFYGSIPYVPFYTASGNLVRFHLVHTDGSISDCPGTYDLQSEHHRAAFLLAAINLHRLVRALLSQAPDRQLRAVQGLEDWQPSRSVNTCIIRHKYHVCKYLYAWDSFVRHYGHSLGAVQAAYAVANKCNAMVSTAATWEQSSSLASLHGPVTKYRSNLGRDLPHEQYLKTVLWRLGWSRQASTLTVEEVCKVVQACLQAASALHADQLVHRDFRYANVLWDLDGPFVIDLEMAARPPLKEPPAQTGWTTETLDNGCFTFGSDIYQIGVMLSELLERSTDPVPSAAADLVHVLKSKVSANEALKHTWLHS
ncbi:hypothetical protein ABBQ38_012896 [Trebouxia sp. C0009 RCD-2024]